MNSKQNNMGANQELCRICPSKLTKHELEDLYFTVLETNIQLRKTINEQQERIKTLSNRMQRKASTQKVLQAEERKNCCVVTNLKVKQQKESIDELRRAHDRTSERIRKLNTQVCSNNQYSRFSPYCTQKSSYKIVKQTPSTPKSKLALADVQKEGIHTSSTPKSKSALTDVQKEETHTQSTLKSKSALADVQKEDTDERLPPKDSQTEMSKNKKTFISVGTQTELPRDRSSQSANIQTELPKDQISQSAATQTKFPNYSVSVISAQTQTESPQRYVSLVSVDNQTESMRYDFSDITLQTQTESPQRNVSLVSVKNETDSMSKIVYKYHAIKNREEIICDENKCRTLMDELKQKINNLVQELAKTHREYSDRINRLEIEVQEYRNENVDSGFRHLVGGQDGSIPSEKYWNQLINNLKMSAGYTVDLKLQLARERGKVVELASQLRDAQIKNRLTNEVKRQLVNSELEESREIKKQSDPGQPDYNWTCNCDPHCPNIHCPFGKIMNTTQRIYKHKCNPTCWSNNNSPSNSNLTTSNNVSEQNTNDNSETNAKVDSNKDLNNSQYLPDTKNNTYPTNHSKRIFDGNIKEIPISLAVNQDILDNSKKQDYSSTDSSPESNQSWNIDEKENNEMRPDATPMQSEPDANQGRHASSDDNEISQEQACVNKLSDNVNAGQNNLDTQKLQIQSKDKRLSEQSDSLENRKKASPSLLVKNLVDINEEQTKTVAELRRQLSNSTKLLSNAETERTQDGNLKTNVDKNGASTDMPVETICLMRVLSVLAENTTSEQKDNKDTSTNTDAKLDDSQKPVQAGVLNSDLKADESEQNTLAIKKISIPEETMGLLRLVCAVGENISNNVTDRKRQIEAHNATISSKAEVPKVKSRTELATTNHDETNSQIQSETSRKRYEYVDDNGFTSKTNHEEVADTELDVEKNKEPLRASNTDLVVENVESIPTKDKVVEKGTQYGEEGTMRNKNERGTIKTDEKTTSWTSMNNLLQTGTDLSSHFKTVNKESQVEHLPEKLEKQNTQQTQREITTYRRHSGTLCFKTVPASKRSQLCQCDEQSHCDMVLSKGFQTESRTENVDKYQQASCASGNTKCTRIFSQTNMKSQLPSTSAISNAAANSRQLNENNLYDSFNQSSTNQLNTLPADERHTFSINPRSNFSHKTSIGSSKNANETLHCISEELTRYNPLSQPKSLLEGGVEIHNTAEPKACEEVLHEFDAGCQLKRGLALKSVNENYSPRCVFVLHIGTVVLSDEAVLISRDKSMELAWKFYDQEVTTSQMRAGRVVVFDFSTEYDMNITDAFLNYMKHDELQIVICPLDEPNKPIASCSLPLRDALLNTNRRADMSLALVAGPQLIYAREVNNEVSDTLDAGDEMGVLDLWCMLRVETQFVPLINKAIAQNSKTMLLNRDRNMSDFKCKIKQTDNNEPSNRENKKSQKAGHNINDEHSNLQRWGSSVMRLPSREVSKRSLENNKLENNSGGYSDVNIQEYKHRDSSGFRTPNTVEVDHGVMPKHNTSSSSHIERKQKRKSKKDTTQSPATTSTAVQYNFQDDFPEHMIINEVFANIRTPEDVKRVMNRVSLQGDSRVSDPEVEIYKKETPHQQHLQDLCSLKQAGSQQKIKDISTSRQIPSHQQLQDLSTLTYLNTLTPVHQTKKYKKFDTESTLSQEMSQEPTVLLPTSSLGSKRSDMTNINRKYDNIAKLYAKYNSQKNEGMRQDLSKKQVTINSKQASIVSEEPQKENPDEEEETIEITVLWLALNEECEAMLNPRVQRVYVAYEFLGRSGADLETPVSLPKPKHYVDKCYYNFKKTFPIDKNDMALLGEMARSRASSQVSKSNRDCVMFSVISEPPEDPLGLDICEDIGYAYLYLGDLLAYSAGSPGYTEVVPVRSRSGTSVCGVLAVRLDGLDVLRRCVKLIDSKTPRME